jgi:nucleoid DNA-binding protein
MSRKDVVEELKQRTGFYKYNIEELLNALDDIIVENMNMATYDEPSEIILFNGWRIGAKRFPEREWREPRYGGTTITPEKIIPYCKLKQSFRQRINNLEERVCDEEPEENEYESDE